MGRLWPWHAAIGECWVMHCGVSDNNNREGLVMRGERMGVVWCREWKVLGCSWRGVKKGCWLVKGKAGCWGEGSFSWILIHSIDPPFWRFLPNSKSKWRMIKGKHWSLALYPRLDCDRVYQQQWRRSPVTVSSIQDYLAKIRKRSWVLAECLSRVPQNLDAARELLLYGLRGTDLEVGWVGVVGHYLKLCVVFACSDVLILGVLLCRKDWGILQWFFYCVKFVFS